MNSADQFETIVWEHYEALFRFAMSLTHSEYEARDLTQQSFYLWATKGHQLRDVSKVKSWLFSTLHHAFLGTQRRHARFSHQPLEEVSGQLPSIPPNIGEGLDVAETLNALARVDEVYRAALVLFYLEDFSYKEIAGLLQVPLGTVKSRISRGIEQLREALTTGPGWVSRLTEN